MTRMFGHHVRSEVLALYLAEGISVFLMVFGVLAFASSGSGAPELGRAVLAAGALAVATGVILSASGLYLPLTLNQSRRLATSTAVATAQFIVIAQIALVLVAPPVVHASPAAMLLLLVMGAVSGVIIARCIHAAALGSGLLRRQLLVVRDATGDPDDTADGRIMSLTTADLAQAMRPGWLQSNHIWAVVLPGSDAGLAAFRQHCDTSGVRVMTKDQFTECRLNRVDFDRLPSDWLDTTGVKQQRGLQALLRRSFDIAIALLLLLLTLPLMLLAALAVRIDSNGPVFYRQVRCGLNGVGFELIKFRSMKVDAEVQGVPVWATKADPRVTRVGRFMRLTRIDELPQLLNVLRGEMSMVGPRPERPTFVRQLGEVIPHYNARASVKPGITGWAQVNYPYGASVEDARMKLAYDLYYVRNRSLFLDMLILVATVRVVLFQEGAR